MGLFQLIGRFFHWLTAGRGHDVDELSRRLEIPWDELKRFRPYYRSFFIPKRSGGRRRLRVPSKKTKELQRRILRRILGRLRAHPAATGFERGQSIATNARMHVNQAVVVRMDLKSFFIRTDRWRVLRYFRTIGWNNHAAGKLWSLCVDPKYGGLPPGAPTSPRLSNLVNYPLDARLSAMAKRLGAVYTRYADDITVSFAEDDRKKLRFMIRFVRKVAAEYGYQVHKRKKMSVRRRHQQQNVTGLVVNERVNLPRSRRRWLRAVEHHLKTGRKASLTPSQLEGWKALRNMVDAQANQ